MEWHEDFPNILCGVDGPTGTTWLALNKRTGDIAFVTNYLTARNKASKDYDSRGILVLEYVKIKDPTIDDKMFNSFEEY